LFTHDGVGLLQFVVQLCEGSPVGRHEFGIGAHVPAASSLHLPCGVQQVPGVPAGGALSTVPFWLFTQ
jgi:hypothetical protein